MLLTEDKSTINSQFRYPEAWSLIPRIVIQTWGKKREREVFKTVSEYQFKICNSQSEDNCSPSPNVSFVWKE